MAKKTLKFPTEEKHSDFEKISIKPTKALDLDGFEDEEFEVFTTADLEYKLNHEHLSENQIKIIKKIIKDRK
ncbi:MAG: hypothetical protein ACRC4M_00755 [Mycoplasma sp.]